MTWGCIFFYVANLKYCQWLGPCCVE